MIEQLLWLVLPFFFQDYGSGVPQVIAPTVRFAQACPECTAWWNFEPCGNATNDSDADGACDIDDSPRYTVEDPGREFTVEAGKLWTNQCCGDTSAVQTATGLAGGQTFVAHIVLGAGNATSFRIIPAEGVITPEEGRALILIRWDSIIDTEVINATTTSGSGSGQNDWRFQVLNTNEWRFFVRGATGTANLVDTSTLNFVVDHWYAAELAWCNNGATETCTIGAGGDEVVEIFVNGVSEAQGSGDFEAILAGSWAALGLDASSGTTEYSIALWIIADEDSVDLWDRYAGTCSDGIIRCFHDEMCTAGEFCNSPPPTFNYPGAGG